MRRNHLNISGIDVLDNELGKYFIYEEYSVFSLIRLFLYCLNDIEWIEEISWRYKEMFWELVDGIHVDVKGDMKQLFELMFYVREDIGIEGLEEMMITTIEQVKKHLEDIGLSTTYGPENPVRTIMARILVSSDTSIKFWLIQRGGKKLTWEDF